MNLHTTIPLFSACNIKSLKRALKCSFLYMFSVCMHEMNVVLHVIDHCMITDLQVTSNGLISFGQTFPNFGATLFPNEADSTVFTAFVAAPYWADIDNRNMGEIWYETHTGGQSAISDSLLELVSNLVRSEQDVPSFQGRWMVVATWNESIPFAGTGDVVRMTVSIFCLQLYIHVMSVSLHACNAGG